MLVAQNSLGPVCPVPLTVRGNQHLEGAAHHYLLPHAIEEPTTRTRPRPSPVARHSYSTAPNTMTGTGSSPSWLFSQAGGVSFYPMFISLCQLRSRPGNSRHEELRLRAGRYTSHHCVRLKVHCRLIEGATHKYVVCCISSLDRQGP